MPEKKKFNVTIDYYKYSNDMEDSIFVRNGKDTYYASLYYIEKRVHDVYFLDRAGNVWKTRWTYESKEDTGGKRVEEMEAEKVGKLKSMIYRRFRGRRGIKTFYSVVGNGAYIFVPGGKNPLDYDYLIFVKEEGRVFSEELFVEGRNYSKRVLSIDGIDKKNADKKFGRLIDDSVRYADKLRKNNIFVNIYENGKFSLVRTNMRKSLKELKKEARRSGKSLSEVYDEYFGKDNSVKYFGSLYYNLFYGLYNSAFNNLAWYVETSYSRAGKADGEYLPSGKPRCGHKYLKKKIRDWLEFIGYNRKDATYFAKVVAKKFHAMNGDPEFDRRLIEKGIRQLMAGVENEKLLQIGYSMLINAHRVYNPDEPINEETIRKLYEPVLREYLYQAENQL